MLWGICRSTVRLYESRCGLAWWYRMVRSDGGVVVKLAVWLTSGIGVQFGKHRPFVSCTVLENGSVPVVSISREATILAISKNSPKPPRTAVLPSPMTSQAKPNRGAKLLSDGFLYNPKPVVPVMSC